MGRIELKDISKSYCIPSQTVDVLKNLSLVLEGGKITVLLGKSGSGKTSILRLISGLEKLDDGEIIPLHRKTSFVFQEARLMPWLNVEKNIAFSRKKNEQSESRITELIEMMKLEKFRNAYPNQLSGGMKQRVQIARALYNNAEFMLMDEPFSALDVFTRNEMIEELLTVHNLTGTGILFVTHNIDEAILLADKIVVLKDGKITFSENIGKEQCKRSLADERFISMRVKLMDEIKE